MTYLDSAARTARRRARSLALAAAEVVASPALLVVVPGRLVADGLAAGVSRCSNQSPSYPPMGVVVVLLRGLTLGHTLLAVVVRLVRLIRADAITRGILLQEPRAASLVAPLVVAGTLVGALLLAVDGGELLAW